MELIILFLIFICAPIAGVVAMLSYVGDDDLNIMSIAEEMREGDKYKYMESSDDIGYWVTEIVIIDNNYVLYDEYYYIDEEDPVGVVKNGKLNKITTRAKLAKNIYLTKSIKF